VEVAAALRLRGDRACKDGRLPRLERIIKTRIFCIMTRIITAITMTIAILLASCAQQSRTIPRQQSPRTIAGTVTGLSDGHGNAYTSIRPDEYESLGLVVGNHIRVAFNDTELTMVIGRDYTDVPTGTPLAVLHREGLTFAIRDGNFSQTYGIAVGDTFRISPEPAE
jgi:S-adenosylmethionine hydrolase